MKRVPDSGTIAGGLGKPKIGQPIRKKVPLHAFDAKNISIESEIQLWKLTTQGQWCLKHCWDLYYTHQASQVVIVGTMTERDYTIWLLEWIFDT